MLVIGAVVGLAAFKMNDNATCAEQLMAQDMITIKNTTPFELQNLTVLYNNETCFIVYMDDDMTLGVNSNIVND